MPPVSLPTRKSLPPRALPLRALHVRTLCLALALVGAAALTSACAPLVVAGAGAGSVAASDRRSVGAFVDDAAIELRAKALATADDALRQDAHINVTSVNGIVLLSGEARTAELRDRLLADVRAIPSIRRVVNEIRVAAPSSAGARSRDTWITTKIKSKLMVTRDLNASRVKVVTEDRSVYLLGLVTPAEGEVATEAARRVNGVARVVKLFEFLE